MYGIIADNQYIYGVVKNGGVQISEDEYNTILQAFKELPEPPNGYIYFLDVNDYSPVMVEASEPEPTEPTAEEALNIILGENP